MLYPEKIKGGERKERVLTGGEQVRNVDSNFKGEPQPFVGGFFKEGCA